MKIEKSYKLIEFFQLALQLLGQSALGSDGRMVALQILLVVGGSYGRYTSLLNYPEFCGALGSSLDIMG